MIRGRSDAIEVEIDGERVRVCPDCKRRSDRRIEWRAAWTCRDADKVFEMAEGIGVGQEYCVGGRFPSFHDDGLNHVRIDDLVDLSRGLLIYGPAGTHKTHLLAARTAWAAYRGMTARLVPWLDLYERHVASHQPAASENTYAIRNEMINLDYLALDDIGVDKHDSKATGAAYRFLYGILDSRKSKQKTTDIATNLSPDEISSYYQDTMGRLMRRLFEMMHRLEMTHPRAAGREETA